MIYLLVILFALTKSERNLIGSGKKDKTLFPIKKGGNETDFTIWYNEKDYKGSWWIENVFSFLGNGWHLNDWINMMCAYGMFGLLVGNLWCGIIAFVLGGTFHSLRNGSLLRKGLK